MTAAILHTPRRRAQVAAPMPQRPRSAAHALLVTLAERGRGRAVHESDAVVISHREHGRWFSLPRHASIPDAGRVRAELARLVRRGFVERVRPRTVRVTAAGRRAAAHWRPLPRKPRRASGAPPQSPATPESPV